MELKSLFANVIGELKQLAQGQHLTVNQLFYFALVMGKVSNVFDIPWWMVIGLPLASPAHMKEAVGALVGMAHKFADGLAKKK